MADAVVYRAMLDIQAAIRGAIDGGTLVGLNSQNVAIQKIPTDRGQQLPFLGLSLLSEDDPLAGLNARDDIVYGILVAMVAVDNQDVQDNLKTFAQFLNWRQNVRRLFHAKQLGPRTTENVIMWVKTLQVVHPGAYFSENLLLSMQAIYVTCREQRSQG